MTVVPGVGRSLVSLRHRSTDAWHRFWRRAETTTVADAYFIGSVIASLVLLGFFWPLIAAMWGPDWEVLSCSSRPLHRTYSITMSLMTAGLGLTWYKFVRYLRRRRVTGGRVAVAKWGGLAWVVVIAVVMTMPWRLLWDNEHPRAMLDGEQAYVLMETETDWVIFSPDSHSAERIQKGDGRQPVVLRTRGYLFEDSGSFLGPVPGC